MVHSYKALLGLLASLAFVIAEDYVCPAGQSSTTVSVGAGDAMSFFTQEGDKYTGNVNCEINYEKTDTCRQLLFDCEEFSLGKGDFLAVSRQTKKGVKTRRFRNKKFKVQKNNGDITVQFKSNKKKQGAGAVCYVECSKAAPGVTTTTSGPGSSSSSTEAPTSSTTSGPTPSTSSPNPTSGPNPGGPAETKTLTISQTWSQEPNGYQRTAKLAIPETAAGEKVPVVLHLHGNGGQGATQPFGNFLGDKCIIVAPDGYERSWNVYTEKSKADDVQFILDLIAKMSVEVPQADMNNVNIAGTSNGAALTYQLLINTGADRPFKRAFPMVSSLIGPQYNNDQFWKFSTSAAAGSANNFDTPMVPTFSSDFEYAHFHGTNDGLIQYEGQNPGPALLNNAEVIAAQLTDYIWAKAMGYTGAQIPDADGVSVGTTAKPTEEYKYLDGRCRHYKLIDEGHGTGPSHPIVQQVVREMILGPGV